MLERAIIIITTFFIALTGLTASRTSWAGAPSYHVAHPIAWMHDLPVGEMPGWSSRFWFSLEGSQSNIWSEKFDMTDRRNGNLLTYQQDFEQGSAILDLGAALTDSLAMGVELPFGTRGGGFLDDFIDQFHQFIGSDRFMRDYNGMFGDNMVVQVNNVDQLTERKKTALANTKLKFKYWLLKWKGSANGSCDCGFAVSGQVKFPVASSSTGWTSGHNDYSLLFHLGAPLGQYSGIWATAAITQLGKNDIFKDWPQRHWAQMYELSMDFAFDQSWGLLLQGRAESPLFFRGDLDFNYPVTDPQAQIAYRVGSAWNSLVYWRGTETIGLRWRSTTGHQINFLFLEDWWIGTKDSRADRLYVSNAPDVSFVTQLHVKF